MVNFVPQINRQRYLDKARGCWTGKNIGGTLGAPFEGRREMNDVSFYTQKLSGTPVPNDDLDLQLIWLIAAEACGIYNLNERILGEYWLNYITGAWNEYGVCKNNLRNGLIPPLSGSCNNEKWKNSNGAWIRSEIWACTFPGCPDEAAYFAYCDACCDHAGEGIWSAIFTAALESAAFVVDDIRRLIEIGLAKIPSDCRTAQIVRLVCQCFDRQDDYRMTRQAVVEAVSDLGWFQAPGNLGFVLIGLLYGQQDFGRSICLAVNCGDDTDCTGATVGAILGILDGRSGLPGEWIEPIGEGIRTCSVGTFDDYGRMNLPKTLAELTERVFLLAEEAQRQNPFLPQFNDAPDDLPLAYIEQLTSSRKVAEKVWTRKPYEVIFDLPVGKLAVEYENGPTVIAGEEKKLTLQMLDVISQDITVAVKLLIPDDWSISPCREVMVSACDYEIAPITVKIVPARLSEAFYYLPLEIRLSDRFYRFTVYLPMQQESCVSFTHQFRNNSFYDTVDQRKLRVARNVQTTLTSR